MGTPSLMPISNETGTSLPQVAAPGLVGQSFEAAIVGAAPGPSSNGPARIFLSPTLMMAEAIGTGDLLAVRFPSLDCAEDLLSLLTFREIAGSVI